MDCDWQPPWSRREISASLAWHGLPQLANRDFLLRIEYSSQQMDREAGFGPVKDGKDGQAPVEMGEMGEMDPLGSSRIMEEPGCIRGSRGRESDWICC